MPHGTSGKHLLGAKVELRGAFVQMGKYHHRRGEWHLIKWETALPSRIRVKLPANVAEQIEAARGVTTVLVSLRTPWP